MKLDERTVDTMSVFDVKIKSYDEDGLGLCAELY
jgi:hypothetical protein